MFVIPYYVLGCLKSQHCDMCLQIASSMQWCQFCYPGYLVNGLGFTLVWHKSHSHSFCGGRGCPARPICSTSSLNYSDIFTYSHIENMDVVLPRTVLNHRLFLPIASLSVFSKFTHESYIWLACVFCTHIQQYLAQVELREIQLNRRVVCNRHATKLVVSTVYGICRLTHINAPEDASSVKHWSVTCSHIVVVSRQLMMNSDWHCWTAAQWKQSETSCGWKRRGNVQ